MKSLEKNTIDARGGNHCAQSDTKSKRNPCEILATHLQCASSGLLFFPSDFFLVFTNDFSLMV